MKDEEATRKFTLRMWLLDAENEDVKMRDVKVTLKEAEQGFGGAAENRCGILCRRRGLKLKLKMRLREETKHGGSQREADMDFEEGENSAWLRTNELWRKPARIRQFSTLSLEIRE